LARQLASPMADKVRPDLLAAAATAPVELSTVDAGPALNRVIAQANRAVLVAKGLPVDGTSLLQIRLGHPDMRPTFTRGETPLIAPEPTDDVVTTVTVYDRDGTRHVLDGNGISQWPVFVVEVDTEKALPLGLEVMRTMLSNRNEITYSFGGPR